MELLEFSGNLALAALLGTLIGIERELHQHPAGLRTNALVCVGAALFISLTKLMGDTNSPTRIAAYIVSGVGFLGGGAILKEGANVHGLTTAAGLWCSAAVGALAGAGFGFSAAIGTGFVLAVVLGMRPLSRWVDSWGKRGEGTPTFYRLKVNCRDEGHAAVRAALARYIGEVAGLTLHGITVSKPKRRKRVVIRADAIAKPANDRAIQDAIARLLREPGVRAASWEKFPVPPE